MLLYLKDQVYLQVKAQIKTEYIDTENLQSDDNSNGGPVEKTPLQKFEWFDVTLTISISI